MLRIAVPLLTPAEPGQVCVLAAVARLVDGLAAAVDPAIVVTISLRIGLVEARIVVAADVIAAHLTHVMELPRELPVDDRDCAEQTKAKPLEAINMSIFFSSCLIQEESLELMI